ncbi:hypothetical protein ACFPRL_14010 [Pseudoclavibacter helvolus]
MLGSGAGASHGASVDSKVDLSPVSDAFGQLLLRCGQPGDSPCSRRSNSAQGLRPSRSGRRASPHPSSSRPPCLQARTSANPSRTCIQRA